MTNIKHIFKISHARKGWQGFPDDSLVKKSLKKDFRKIRGRGRPPKELADIEKGTSLPVSNLEEKTLEFHGEFNETKFYNSVQE